MPLPRPLRWAPLVLLPACATRTESHCEFETIEIADDDVTDLGVSAEDALRAIAPQSVDAVDLFGNVVPIELTLARGDGPVLLVDATVVEEVLREGGRNTSGRWLGPDPCSDTLAIPVTLSLVGEGVDLHGAATLENDPDLHDAEWLVLTRPLDPAVDALPAGLGEPAGGELRLGFRAGALSELDATVLTAEGTRETVLYYRVAP